jgi:acyl-CoA dehydrogenase
MDFGYDTRTERLRAELTDFMQSHVYPAEHLIEPADPDAAFSWERPAVMAELKSEARRRGLWNLFLPHSPLGAGLSNTQYAPLAEITGRSPLIAPEALNCAAPDTGNMELLSIFGTEDQKARWLAPLLDGTIRSAYCMTEPDVASSDASNIALRIEADGDGYLLNGTKWWSTGALSSDCKVLLVLGVTDPGAERHSRHSVVMVPIETPGITIRRGLSVFGFWDQSHGGHGEVTFDHVRVGHDALLGERGKGFALGQARLGPGRIHHCMRMVGMAERAFDLMCTRANQRIAFGKPLADHGDVQRIIAEARVRIDQLRLLVLRTAWLIDTVGAKEAATEISEIKIAAPPTAQWVIEHAIQLHGAAGLTHDFPLAMLFAQARSLRFADGPEEVHRSVLARRELKRYPKHHLQSQPTGAP